MPKKGQGKGKERPMTFEDLMRIERVSAPSVHPSGKYVAFVLSRHDHVENKVHATIMHLEIDTGEVRELTPGEHKDSSPAWSPDGKMLAFVSDREEGSQIWVLPYEQGGEAFKVTSGKGGASGPVWAPDSRRIAFARSVVVSPHWDGDTEGISGDDKEKVALARTYGLVNERSSARIETSLLYRHWDQWRDMKRSHIFIVDIEKRKAKDITPFDADVPPISLGGVQDFSFSPEGDEMVYVMNPDPVVAVSTNNSVFIQRIDGIKPKGKPRAISRSEAMEMDPRYSPDGRYIAYLGAERRGYEADRLRVKVHDRKKDRTMVLTEGLDRSASEPVWSEDSKRLYFLAQDLGRTSLYSADLKGIARQHTSGMHLGNLRSLPGQGLLVTAESMTSPADIHKIVPGEGYEPVPGKDLPADITRLTGYGKWLGDELDVVAPEEFWYESSDGTPIHGFLIKPPGFKPKRKYPLIFLVHGGPQSAFMDHFHYRWNPQLFASEGYVVTEINPRGSTGYGQSFTDQISGDWGGQCYTDLMMGLEHILARYEFIDGERMVAAGASFGGFMVNWIAGHPNRFKALVSHDGIFNQETMSYMTEELWFDIWEHGGMPHQDHASFLKFSPHMNVQNFKTPMLVVQGEQDFRCPVSEGIALFTALQVMGVPSKFLYFPDEGHWVMRPANSQVWYHTILEFIREHLG